VIYGIVCSSPLQTAVPIESCQFGKLDTASLGGAAWMPTIEVVDEKVGTTITTTLKNGVFNGKFMEIHLEMPRNAGFNGTPPDKIS